MKLRYILAIIVVFTSGILASEELKHSYGELYATPMQIERPATIVEVQVQVAAAKKLGRKVAVVGAGLSQGKHSLATHGLLLDMRAINHIRVDDHELTVGAGALWSDVQKVINRRGLSLKVMQGSNIFSVGGSLSANCHGWDFRSGSIINVVNELTIVNSDGKLLRLTPEEPLFSGVIGGYGCLGVIVEAKLQLADNVLIRESAEKVRASDYVAYFNKKIATNPNILMHRYRLAVDGKRMFKVGFASNYEVIDEKPQCSDLESKDRLEKLLSRAIWMMRHFPSSKRWIWNFGRHAIMGEKVMTRNEIMNPPVKIHFEKQRGAADWLQEYYVPPDQLASFLQDLAGILRENRVNLLSTTVRYVKKNDRSLLSYAPNQDCFAVVLFFNQSLKWKKVDQTAMWTQKAIDLALAKGGTYYLPYHHFASLGQFRASYPQWKQFREMKETYDKEDLFSNGFYQDYFTK